MWLKVTFFFFLFSGFSGNFGPQLCFFMIWQLSSPWCLPAERAFLLLVEGTENTILAVGGWKATYLFSLWYLSCLACQSICCISIIQATSVQLTCYNMEFNEVLGFLFIFQKILYLEKQRNRDVYQYRLCLKKNIFMINAFLLSSVVTFWNSIFYPEARW